jgi:hypothetical protein
MIDIKKEQLLWKYVDGLCDEQETSEVKALLEKDPEISNFFTSIRELDRMMIKHPIDTLSDNFQLKLEHKLVSEMGKIDFTPVNILPSFVKILFLVMSVVATIFVFLFPKLTSTNSTYDFFGTQSNLTYYNIIAISAGLLFLLFLDKYFQNIGKKGQNLFFLA